MRSRPGSLAGTGRRRAWLALLLAPWVAAPTAAPAAAPADGQSPVQFVDVAGALGVDLLNVSGDSEQQYLVDVMMGGVAFFDHDGDGDLDLYLLNGSRVGGVPDPAPRNALYRNEGGAFTDATDESGLGDPRWGMGVAVADTDNDGDEDVYITNYGRNSFYENRGRGRFVDVTARAGTGHEGFSTGCAFLDYDRDGDVDLYVANYVDFARFMATTPERRYEWRGLAVHFGPRGMDGAPDVFYRNDGDGTFTDVTAAAGLAPRETPYGLGVVAGDYDNDGQTDIYVANDTWPNSLYHNNGDGTFTDVGFLKGVAYGSAGETQGSMGIAFADYDNDLWPDLVVTNFWEETNTLYRNLEGQFFEDRTFDARLGMESFSYLAWGCEFLDIDNDGDRDLFVANGHIFPQVMRANLGIAYAQANQLFENLGDGTFDEVTKGAGPGLTVVKVSRGVAVADYDDDGDLDVAVLNLNDVPTLLRNDGGNRNHWLSVRTEGTRSNRDGIGARLTLRAGGRTQVGEVRSGGSYLSHSDRRVHFGLGAATTVALLEVRWPSGAVDRFVDLPVNQVFVAREGSGDD